MSNFRKSLKKIYPFVDKASPIAIVVVGIATIVSYNLDNNLTEESRTLNLIVSLLTILVISALWDKFKFFIDIEERLDELGKGLQSSKISSAVSADEFFDDSNEPSPEFLSSANEIFICGITLGETIRRLGPVLTERLESSATVRILFLDKEKVASLNQLVIRSWSDRASKEGFQNNLEATEDMITHISNSKKASGILEVGLLPVIPAIGIIMIDPNQSNGAAFIEFYKHKEKASFKFKVSNNRDPNTIREFHDQFNTMWSSSQVKKLL